MYCTCTCMYIHACTCTRASTSTYGVLVCIVHYRSHSLPWLSIISHLFDTYLFGLTVDDNKIIIITIVSSLYYSILLLPQFVHLRGGGRLWVHVWGEDRQPVPRAKLFCLRFCGRIGFVARFTLTLDKHLFSVLDWGTMGGAEVRRGPGRAIILAGRPRRTIISGITPKAAAPGWCTEYIRNVHTYV